MEHGTEDSLWYYIGFIHAHTQGGYFAIFGQKSAKINQNKPK